MAANIRHDNQVLESLTRNNAEISGAPAEAAEVPMDQTVEVLYQKMGDRWFVFSLVGDDVYMGSISQSQIEETASGDSDLQLHKVTGNS